MLALIAYRMETIAIGHLALRYSMSWASAPSIEIYFDRVLSIEGAATTFTNGAIEAAIVHSRALLEFLGLGSGGPESLRELTDKDRRNDDAAIERFSLLGRLTISEVCRAYPGDQSEAERALARVIYLANKGLAHTSHSFTKDDEDAHLLEIAFRGVPELVVGGFHQRLGLPTPDYKLKARSRTVFPIADETGQSV